MKSLVTEPLWGIQHLKYTHTIEEEKLVKNILKLSSID